MSKDTTEEQQDLARFAWLVKKAKEEYLHSKTLSSDFPDMRTYWKIPTLICSGPIGGFIEFREAIDIAMKNDKN